MRYKKWMAVAAVACMIASAGLAGNSASAQDATGDINQIALSETQVKGLIAAQPSLAAIAKKLENAPESNDVSIEKELDEIAQKHGFKNFAELDDVSANVQLVLDGIDPENGEYTDPVVGLKEELAEVKGDTTMPADEKKALIEELEEALTSIPPLKHKENIDLVKKHQQAIQDALDAGDAGR
ncbi:MAG: hypothetical protein KJ622_02920 [Alphaproteobacteria bacterium]|nr:hypothetical protein [Alphaproteobacteria bacterium]